MRGPGWYVVQVQTGKEDRMCQVIERACGEDALGATRAPGDPLLQECFSPRYQTQHKFEGQWRTVEKQLLPGYVVAVTAHPHALARRLRRVPEFTRLLSAGEMFVPLRDDERAWMEEFTKAGERTIAMSFAYREGDTLVVTEGPLKGHEGMVYRVSRRKSLAFVELQVGGKTFHTTVGLAIVSEEHDTNAASTETYGTDRTSA